MKKELLNEIPDTFHEFQIDLVGQVTKKRFLGEFKCKIPTLKDQALIDKHLVMLNGDNPMYLSPGVLKMHKMIAYCRFTLTETPSFWTKADLGYDLRDFNVIEGVYDNVIAFENKWLESIWGAGDDDGSETKEEA